MGKRDNVPGLSVRLKQFREAAGMSQYDAAKASGVNRVSINVYEAGTKTPTVATLIKLARAYGVCLDDLIPCEKPRKPKK